MTDTEDESKESRWQRAICLINQGDARGAIYALRALATDGELSALREIARIYQVGGNGVPPSPEKAEHWYRKSIDQADDAYSCLGLATLYRSDALGSPNYEYSLHYLQLAEKNALPEVYFLLGKHYGLGQGIPVDYEKAVNYYRLASEGGNLVAKKNLAILQIKRGKTISGSIAWLRSVLRIGIRFASSRSSPSLFGL
jgi:TPR repeat protein